MRVGRGRPKRTASVLAVVGAVLTLVMGATPAEAATGGGAHAGIMDIDSTAWTLPTVPPSPLGDGPCGESDLYYNNWAGSPAPSPPAGILSPNGTYAGTTPPPGAVTVEFTVLDVHHNPLGTFAPDDTSTGTPSCKADRDPHPLTGVSTTEPGWWYPATAKITPYWATPTTLNCQNLSGRYQRIGEVHRLELSGTCNGVAATVTMVGVSTGCVPNVLPPLPPDYCVQEYTYTVT